MEVETQYQEVEVGMDGFKVGMVNTKKLSEKFDSKQEDTEYKVSLKKTYGNIHPERIFIQKVFLKCSRRQFYF